MKLTKYLSDQGYDLIEGPIRNHKPLQLWVKKAFSEAELYYATLKHAFKSEEVLTEIENQALSVNTSNTNEYGFNIGITLLEEILSSLGLGAVEISAAVKTGKKVVISYDNSITKEYAIGNIESYLSAADFVHPNPQLLKNANKDNILIITGTVFAKNLVVEIETDFTIDVSLIAKLNNIADGKIDFTAKDSNTLKMVSGGNNFFPIAVKASRIKFDRSIFKKLTLVTDDRNIF
ncbi:gasdermin [Flavobacterium terrae]|uniref:Gasdermin bGSDM n=1 Tax=Flavobacterium terrae TaxID=415425 RepID=A0A1M6CPU3_9FLAO|nr:hypothetical protein [Flavobacterium terrae]SHI63115.1 hypothetical protein SAMN05444363_1038 [Flavobacterium terrae]